MRRDYRSGEDGGSLRIASANQNSKAVVLTSNTPQPTMYLIEAVALNADKAFWAVHDPEVNETTPHKFGDAATLWAHSLQLPVTWGAVADTGIVTTRAMSRGLHFSLKERDNSPNSQNA
jgi:hypothetical protein